MAGRTIDRRAGVLSVAGALEWRPRTLRRHRGRLRQSCDVGGRLCVADPITVVRMLDEADKRFAGRTVTLRAEPYLPEGEMDRFVIHSVLK